MQIPQTLIDKYQLTDSGEQAGDSFMKNLRIFKSSFPYMEPVRFMECDLSGRSTNLIVIYNKVSKKYIMATPEYLLDTNHEMLIAQLKDPNR